MERQALHMEAKQRNPLGSARLQDCEHEKNGIHSELCPMTNLQNSGAESSGYVC
jgi:hypothetical protein